MKIEPRFLEASPYIDWQDPAVTAMAHELAHGADTTIEIARRCFVFVRDRIHHSWDFHQNPVTCKASEVLRHSTGYCYAKSHLLAALLRANHIPAGLCYQRLSVGESGPPYCLHGLNAVFLEPWGWYRIDARGNKPGVVAEFSPPEERLAFAIREAEEKDLPEIRSDPLPVVIQALTQCTSVDEVHANLPDIGSLL